MNIIKKTWIVFTIVALPVVLLYAQQSYGVYDYPIKPGTAEWKTLTSHDQMINVCQIPQAIIANMTTEDLIETCLNYPLFGDILAFEQIQNGFEVVSAHFNGMKELLKRKDAGTVLLKNYKEMDPNAIDQNWPLEKKGEYVAKFWFVEILIAQEEILTELKKTQMESLLAECIVKVQEKAKYPDGYGMLSNRNILLIAGRIMLIEKFDPFIQKTVKDENLKMFLKDGFMPDVTLVEEILNFTIQYLNKN